MINSPSDERRVVITGLGLVSPLGSSPATLWQALLAGKSGVRVAGNQPGEDRSLRFFAEALEFTGAIGDFGKLTPAQTKAIRKGLKVMCRETQMAVAAAQLAISDAQFPAEGIDPESFGVVLGSDYMLTMPQDYADGMLKCSTGGTFDFTRWGNEGLGEMAPLWMLKYLPNMPASHIAIFNDLRGPNNSLTMREAASNLAIGEAFRTVQRGHADRMVAGATGTRVLPMQRLHVLQTEQIADASVSPAAASRPFDKDRTGMVAGEGAGMVVLEELTAARSRGAKIYAEVRGLGSSSIADRELHGQCGPALAAAAASALRDAGVNATDVGHINAHGLSTESADRAEAEAIQQTFGSQAAKIPVTALKSYFGNLGAGSGAVELIASVLALEHGRLPRILNYETPDPACPVAAVTDDSTSPGGSFLSLSVTPQGQAAALYVTASGAS